MKLVLPYPISANRYWATMAMRNGAAVTYVTKEAKDYKRKAKLIALTAGMLPITRPIELAFTLHPPAVTERFDKSMRKVEVKCGTRMDLDNALKVAIDAMNGIAYEDDSQVERIRIEYGERRGRGELVIEVAEFVPDLPPIFNTMAESGLNVQLVTGAEKVEAAP